MKVYRGHLRMPLDATADHHKRSKKAFLRTMRRWAVRTGYTVEFHAVQHITDIHNCHWDTVAYSDAPRKPLRAAVVAAWERAGGLRQSLVPLDPEEIESQCRYQAKDVEPERQRGKHFLPATGLQFHWSSSGFWQGHKLPELWKACILEWFPPGEASNSKDTLLQPSDPHQDDDDDAHQDAPESPVVAAVRADQMGAGGGCKSVSLLLDDSPAAVAERVRLLAEIDRRLEAIPRRNAINIYGQLPDHQGISPAAVAEATGLTPEHVRHQLRTHLKDRGAVAPPIPVPGGGWRFDSWYAEPPRPPVPPPGPTKGTQSHHQPITSRMEYQPLRGPSSYRPLSG
jgi:hypothetical protein